VKSYFTILFLLCGLAAGVAQNKADSLKNAVENTANDSLKFDAIVKLFQIYYQASETELYNQYLQKATQLPLPKEDSSLIYRYSHLANMFLLTNNYSELINYRKKIAAIFKAQKDYKNYLVQMNGAAYYYTYLGEDDKSVEQLLNNLRFAEENKLTGETSPIYMFLGFGIRNSDKQKAKEYFQLSIDNQTDTLSPYYFTSLHEIGNILSAWGESEKALPYYLRALNIRKLVNSPTLNFSYHDIALNYKFLGEFEKAISYMLKFIRLEEMKKGNKHDIAISYANLAGFYIDNKQFDKAEYYLKKSLALAEQLQLHMLYQLNYSVFTQLYRAKKDYKKALENYSLQIAYGDSIDQEETTKKIAELDKKYQVEKKETEIKLLQKEKEADNAIIQKQKIIGLAITAVLVLLVITAVTFFKGRERQRKVNQLLSEKNTEVNQQKEEIEAQAEFLARANLAITKQKEEIERSHKKVQSSITYASRIQQALLPSGETFSQLLPQHFVFYKPKDVVSGDFYYLKKINEQYLVVAVADCTGHGVPGAFVSMLGIAFLNEIIGKKEVKTAAQVLEYLRTQVKTSLKQTGDSQEAKDGMDIALCVIDTQNLSLQFAGAYNPLYLIRNGQLTDYKATKSPIGVYPKEKPFENNEIKLQKNDMLYLFSDGYIDQFGGERGMKFFARKFRELLLTIADKPLAQQKQLLNQNIENWKGNYEQIDDMLILGVRI